MTASARCDIIRVSQSFPIKYSVIIIAISIIVIVAAGVVSNVVLLISAVGESNKYIYDGNETPLRSHDGVRP